MIIISHGSLSIWISLKTPLSIVGMLTHFCGKRFMKHLPWLLIFLSLLGTPNIFVQASSPQANDPYFTNSTECCLRDAAVSKGKAIQTSNHALRDAACNLGYITLRAAEVSKPSLTQCTR